MKSEILLISVLVCIMLILQIFITFASHEEKVLGSRGTINSSDMKIHFERSGGMEGIPLSLTLDTSNMMDRDRLELEKLLNETRFFELPSKMRAPKLDSFQGAADYFTYRLVVETDDNKSHSVTGNDLSLPSSLYPLIEFLSQKLR
jgi:hypothetical protein